MTQSEPLHPLDVTFLLHAAELLPGDPQVDDYGTLYAAVARVNARALERDIYGSVYFKAAALLQTLVRLPCLEHSNEAYAWHCAEAYLALNGCRLRSTCRRRRSLWCGTRRPARWGSGWSVVSCVRGVLPDGWSACG